MGKIIFWPFYLSLTVSETWILCCDKDLPTFYVLLCKLRSKKKCLKYNSHRDWINIFNINEGNLHIIPEESRDFSSQYSVHLPLGIKPGACHLNRASGPRANLTSVNFQTKLPALHAAKFSDSKSFGFKPQDPVL